MMPVEHPDELALRLSDLDRKSRIEAWQGVAIFGAIMVTMVVLGSVALYIGVLDRTAPEDTRHWAQNILTALMSGGLSFVVGRKIGAK